MRSRRLLDIKVRLFTVAVVAMSVAPGTAVAQDDTRRTGAARALYDEAVTRMEAGDYETACPKLEASVKLEPAALGAKITLAECYEGDGRLASAWSTYLQVESVAGATKQAARQTKAHERAEALRSKLAQLTLVVPEEVQSLPGLVILRDGLEIESALWSVPIPVDKGSHELVMTATGKKRVAQSFEVEKDRQSVTVKLPRLRDAAPPPAPVSRPAERAPAPVTPYLTRVHIENDDPSKPLQLFRVDGGFSGTGTTMGHGPKGPTFGAVTMDGVVSSSVCSAPCDIGVDASGGKYFFFGGEGIADSERFRLHGTGDPAMFRVSPATRGASGSGLVFAVLGGGGVMFGATMLVIAAKQSSSSVAKVGGVTLGLGAALMALGIPLILSGRTTFTFRGDGVAVDF